MTLVASSHLPDLLGSASHHRDSDDGLKDADNLAFLAGQPADVRAVWLERCRLFRWVDQLAEGARWAFGEFLARWRCTEWLGTVPADVRFSAELHALEKVVFWRKCHRTAFACSSWLDALAADYGRSLAPVTLEQHDAMVEHVGGFFRLFPYLTPEQWESIGAFGALDQAWNNVRDIAEDAAAGRCYFPLDSLHGFGLVRRDVFTGHGFAGAGWHDFMSFWLGEHLPRLAERARPFLAATDLHPSVEAMRASCLRRYARVERVLRGLDFDYRAFPAAYAAEVRRDLGERALGGGVKEIA